MPDETQASASTNAARPPILDNVPLWEILRHLTVAQAWALGVALTAIIVGSVALGAWVQSASDDDKIAQKNSRIAQLENEGANKLREKDNSIVQLQRQNDELNAKIGGAQDALKTMNNSYRAIKGKAEFLERFLTYQISPSDISRKLFVDHVCALWKQSQEYDIHLDRAHLDVTPDQIRRGLSPDILRFLLDNGVPSELLSQARQPDVRPQASPLPRIPDPTPTFAAAQVQKHAQSLTLVKIVRFYDGTTYKVPDEIAAAVHSNRDCAPR